MSSKTTYEVGVKYTMDDKASKGLGNMANAARRAEGSVMTLQRAMVGLGFVAGAATLGKKVLIDYNSEIDSMRIGMTAVIQMQMAKPFEQARKEADGLFLALQKVAKSSPGTTKDFIEMANAIAPAVAAAGGDVKKIETLASGAVIAGKAMGIRADVAALDIKQMLMGTVSARDMLAQQMILARGLNSEQFNAMSGRDRGKFVEEMLTAPAFKKAAQRYGESFEGQTAAITDNLQIMLGKVGLPLMKEVAGVLGEWNKWFEENPRAVADFAKKFGDGIKDAFVAVKDIFSWVVENKETLLSLGKFFLFFKGAGLVTNEIALISRGVKNFADNLGSPTDGLKLFGLSLGNAATAIGAVLLAANEFADWVDRRQTAQLDARANWTITDLSRADHMEGMFGTQDRRKVAQRNYQRAMDEGFLSKDGTVMENLIRATGKEAGATTNEVDNYLAVLRDTVTEMRRFDSTMASMSQSAADAESAFWRSTMGGMEPGTFAGDPSFTVPSKDWAGAPEKAKVNITIQRIEVASEDPDRFVFNMVKAAENVTKNPTQSEFTISGGN